MCQICLNPGIFFNFLSGGAPPQKYQFYQNGDPFIREHVHTGRPHTRINNSVFKKTQCNVLSLKKEKNIQTQCIYVKNKEFMQESVIPELQNRVTKPSYTCHKLSY